MEQPTVPEQPIVPPDKKLRLRVVVVGVVICLAGIFLLNVLRDHLHRLQSPALPPQEAKAAAADATQLVSVVAVIAWLSFVGIGVCLWRLSRQVRKAGQYPLPGTKVIKVTVVRTGVKAEAVANLLWMAAGLIVIAGTTIMWYLWRLAILTLR